MNLGMNVEQCSRYRKHDDIVARSFVGGEPDCTSEVVACDVAEGEPDCTSEFVARDVVHSKSSGRMMQFRSCGRCCIVRPGL